jgi:hypothetical protein
MARYNVDDKLRLKQDTTFRRCFPHGGYRPDGDDAESDKVHMRAGQIVTVAEVSTEGRAHYILQIQPDAQVEMFENRLLELFDPA